MIKYCVITGNFFLGHEPIKIKMPGSTDEKELNKKARNSPSVSVLI